MGRPVFTPSVLEGPSGSNPDVVVIPDLALDARPVTRGGVPEYDRIELERREPLQGVEEIGEVVARQVPVAHPVVRNEIDRERYPLGRQDRNDHVVAVASAQVVQLDRLSPEVEGHAITEREIWDGEIGIVRAAYPVDGEPMRDDRGAPTQALPQDVRSGGVIGMMVTVHDRQQWRSRGHPLDLGREPSCRFYRNRVERHDALRRDDKQPVVRLVPEPVDALGNGGRLEILRPQLPDR